MVYEFSLFFEMWRKKYLYVGKLKEIILYRYNQLIKIIKIIKVIYNVKMGESLTARKFN